MKTLIFGAGPLGCLYTHRLHQAGQDVTLLARGAWYEWIDKNGLEVVDEITGERETSRVRVVDSLSPDDAYDLVIVIIRKNKLPPVFEVVAANTQVENILFMGNNALGFDAYLEKLPREKVLFGFPNAGGGITDHVLHYADRENPGAKPRPVMLGEIDGRTRARTLAIQSLFKSASIPVEITSDIDGWLKYHVAMVAPMACALYQHNSDTAALASDSESLRKMVKAAKEGGRVLSQLGYKRRQPFRFNLFYWLPEFMTAKGVQGLLTSKMGAIAFAMHARSARDEIKSLAEEFRSLIDQTSVATPNIDSLNKFLLD